MKRQISRRHVLLGSLAAGSGLAAFGGLPLLRQLSRANPYGSKLDDDLHVVFCYFAGGWDTLLSLDPRDPADFHYGNVSSTLIQPGYDQVQALDTQPFVASSGVMFGPFIGDLAKWAQDLAVVRGMSMDTLSHEAGRRRFLTGKPPSGLLARGSSASTWLSSALGADDAIPNLSVRVEAYNVDQPTYATALRVSSIRDLLRALAPSEPALSALAGQQRDAVLREAAACEAAALSPTWQDAESSRLRAAAMVQQDLASLFDFQAQTPEMEALRDHYGIAATGAAALDTPEAEAAMAATALKAGVSRVVSIQVGSGLDTHDDAWAINQGPRQRRGFDAVASLIHDLDNHEYRDSGDSWLEHTVVVGFSEFGRTALLNDRGGRDHALTNSCFLIGGGIQGGAVVGASSNVGMSPMHVDLTSGLTDPGGEVIKPEHVLRTLMQLAGFEGDPADLRVDPIGRLLS